jgi:hypothetical protein
MTDTPKRTIGAKVVLYDDGTAAPSVFLIEDSKPTFLTYEVVADRKAAEALIRAHAAENGIGSDDIEIRYEDRRATSRGRRPAPGKAN